MAGGISLPLELGTKVMCKWVRGAPTDVRLAKVVERRKLPTANAADFEYYIHYTEFNRRNDTWVTLGLMDLSTLNFEDCEVRDAAGRVIKKRKVDLEHEEGHEDFDPTALREHEEFTKVRNVLSIELGKHTMDTWYFSPFPDEYANCQTLYFCEFTLEFFKRKEQLQRHLRKVEVFHPPGDEIYRKGSLAMFEVDGRKERLYSQNLCYLAKLFLDHKTLYYDVDLFLFYILCEQDERGCHVVGYFSKEKNSEEGYNLACILTLPPYQRKGYGKFLISFSYELSKREFKVGTPERPLSDLGLVSYRAYWTRILLGIISERQSVSIKELSEETMFKTDDIVSTLQYLNMLAYQKNGHVIVAEPTQVAAALKAAGSAGVEVDSSRVIWVPYNAERDYAGYRS